MASPEMGDRDVTDSAVIRAVLPRNTVKQLARLMGVPFETAKHWTYRRMSAARRRELARALLAEWDARDRAVRPQLLAMAGNDEMDRLLGGAGDAPARRATDRAAVDAVGRDVSR